MAFGFAVSSPDDATRRTVRWLASVSLLISADDRLSPLGRLVGQRYAAFLARTARLTPCGHLVGGADDDPVLLVYADGTPA